MEALLKNFWIQNWQNHCWNQITKNPKSTFFIFQAISMAVQRGNVQCVQGAYGEPAFEKLDEIFYIVKPNNIF